MFGKSLLHSPEEIMRFAITIAAILMLSPALIALIAAMGFIFLPAVIVGLPFLIWTFFGQGEKVHEEDVRRHEYAMQQQQPAHA
jgi:hypothetical protein